MAVPVKHQVAGYLIAQAIVCGLGYLFFGPVGILYGLGVTAMMLVSNVIQFFITPRDQH